MPAGSRYRCQTHGVGSPLVVVERMKQRTIEHRVEHSAKTVEAEGVRNDEVSVDAADHRALARDPDGGRSHVDSEKAHPVGGEVKSIVAGPAARVEHRTGKHARVRQTHHRRLWCSDVPRRRTIAVRRIPWLAGIPLMTGWLSPAIRIVDSEPCLLRHS